VSNESSYQSLDYLIHAYFNQDFDLWGETTEQIISCFRRENDDEQSRSVIADIDRLKAEHSADLDRNFDELYGLYVNPQAWGHTAASFLDEVKRLLAN